MKETMQTETSSSLEPAKIAKIISDGYKLSLFLDIGTWYCFSLREDNDRLNPKCMGLHYLIETRGGFCLNYSQGYPFIMMRVKELSYWKDPKTLAISFHDCKDSLRIDLPPLSREQYRVVDSWLNRCKDKMGIPHD